MSEDTTTTTEVASDAPAGEAAPQALDFNSYLSGLDEPQRELLTKNGVDSFEKQYKFINHLNTQLGKKGLIEPGADATPEEKQAFTDQLYDKLGRPQDGAYDFSLPEGSKDEFYTDEFMNGLAGIAHKYGMNPDGFQDMVNYLASNFNGVVSEWEKTIGEIKAKLGEDKMDDKATAKAGSSKEEIHQQAKDKMIEANDKFKAGDYKNAEILKVEAQKLYNQYANM